MKRIVLGPQTKQVFVPLKFNLVGFNRIIFYQDSIWLLHMILVKTNIMDILILLNIFSIYK
jgi:hypothetical protein